MKKIRKYYVVDAHAIAFGYYPGDGDGGVMSLRWRHSLLQGLHDPKLELHDGAWRYLPLLGDLFRALTVFNSADISPAEFRQLLEECGFVDGGTPTVEEELFDIEFLADPDDIGSAEYRALYDLLEIPISGSPLTTAEAIDICTEMRDHAISVIKVLTAPEPCL